MSHLERTKAPGIFRSLGKRLKHPAFVDPEDMSPEEPRCALSWELCSHPALEMTGFRALPGSGLEADGMSFLLKMFLPPPLIKI